MQLCLHVPALLLSISQTLLFCIFRLFATAMGFRDSRFAAIIFFLCTVTLSAAASPAPPLGIIQPSADDNITSSFNHTLPHSIK